VQAIGKQTCKGIMYGCGVRTIKSRVGIEVHSVERCKTMTKGCLEDEGSDFVECFVENV